MSEGSASGKSTFMMICMVDAPMDCAASMTPPSTSSREDSTSRATKGAAAMTSGDDRGVVGRWVDSHEQAGQGNDRDMRIRMGTSGSGS